MPKIKAEKPLPGDEAVVINKPYEVLTAEEFKSEQQGYNGIRVTLTCGGADGLIAIPLWLRETVGLKSKLGTFMDVLGDNTDDWAGKTIIFRVWQDKNRVIELADNKEKAK